MFANMEEEVKSGWSNEPVEGAEELLAYLHKLQEQIPEEDLPKEALFFLPVGYSGTINDFIKMMEFDPKRTEILSDRAVRVYRDSYAPLQPRTDTNDGQER